MEIKRGSVWMSKRSGIKYEVVSVSDPECIFLYPLYQVACALAYGGLHFSQERVLQCFDKVDDTTISEGE